MSAAVATHDLCGSALAANMPAIYNRFGFPLLTKMDAIGAASGAIGRAWAHEPWQLFLATIFSGGTGLFGLDIGNVTSLPPLIAQADFAEIDVPHAIALSTAIAQATFAFAPATFGLLREWSPPWERISESSNQPPTHRARSTTFYFFLGLSTEASWKSCQPARV